MFSAICGRTKIIAGVTITVVFCQNLNYQHCNNDNKEMSKIFSGVADGAEALAISRTLQNNTNAVIYICVDETRMYNLAESLRFFTGINPILFPAWDCLPYDRVSPNSAQISLRISALKEILECKTSRTSSAPVVVITTVNAALQRVITEDSVISRHMVIKNGSIHSFASLTKFLEDASYNRCGKVMEVGEYVVRGGIIDIFPTGYNKPVRIEFFDNAVESIKTFDAISQITDDDIQKVELLAISEASLDVDSIERFRSGYRSYFGARNKDDALYESISVGRKFAGFEHWLPLFHEKMATLFNYLPDATVIMPAMADAAVDERFVQIHEFYNNRKINIGKSNKLLQSGIYNALPPELLYLTEAEFKTITENKGVKLSPFSDSLDLNLSTVSGKSFAAERGSGLFETLKEHFAALNSTGTKVIIACTSEGSADRISQMLVENGINVARLESYLDIKSPISIAVIPIEKGFVGSHLAVITEQDIFGDRIARPHRRKRKIENFFAEAANFALGQLIVHREHGIGRFEGLVSVEAGGAPHDCLKLIYEGDDKLFVPVENIEIISAFGGETEGIKLDKLGAASWQSRKARVKERIKIAADELIKIAAERELKHTDEMHPDEGIFNEFCARFPYTETEDQERAIADVLEDMASGIPTERLICGDVGFGKTEVALRAAFAAVANNPHSGNEPKKQVVIIGPTTLLARQHYRTFSERFRGMPYVIRQLSRMVTTAEAKETRKMMENGDVDIVIGTHALISKETKLKNLALVIIDEEQHFGVKQKERLKELKADVHVISLSATPIPRTMQMALSGIRKLSLITTPPVDRLAVRTYVMPVDMVVIKEALMREYFRGGRSFYVAPRIKDLDDVIASLKEFVPELKFAVAHGQMTPTDLDGVMNDFYDGKFDILLSTNIVESGLDVPSANTIIIHRSDMFGLSQLYQLRGRVGRGKQRAYAYLTTPYFKNLSPNALRRLEVMQSLDALGAGFSVASHDMDIRGFGNLLGEEQSGQVREVGVELYQQMLEEAVLNAKKNLKNEQAITAEREWSPQINLGLPVMIPEDYVEDLSLRLGLYRRAANLSNADELDAFAVELTDRFGKIPNEVQNLLSIMKIKQLCRSINVERIDVGPKGVVIGFRNSTFANPDKLVDFIARHSQYVKLRPDQRIFFDMPIVSEQDRVKKVESTLAKITALAT